MKGIALSVIAFIIIAVVTIIVLILFVGKDFSPALQKGYCDTVFVLTGVLPIPENLKPTVPTYCKVTQIGTRECNSESADPDRISFDIASCVIGCWKTTGEVGSKTDKICFEVRMKGLEGSLTEDLVKKKLEDVGYGNILDWKAGTITSPKILAIYFNASNNLIGVV